MNSDSSHSYDGSAQHLEVAVIGGGQAGLAIGYFLRQQGRRFVILERASELAPAWRERWDSLTLFTPRRYSALPGLPFPGDPDGYPTRDEVIAYLERYAETFELPVELNSRGQQLDRGDDGALPRSSSTDGRSAPTRSSSPPGRSRPRTCRSSPRSSPPSVFQIHSTSATAGRATCPTGTVLVVGGGNTGFQIAKELSATHKVVLSIGSRQTPLPQRMLGRDLFWWLTKTGLLNKTVDSRLGRKLRSARHADRLEPARADEALRRRAQAARSSTPRARRCASRTGASSRSTPSSGRPATAPTTRGSTLPIFDEDGRVRHRRGVTDVPGLYFLGLHLAAHARLGADRLGQGRRRVHRRADRAATSSRRQRAASTTRSSAAAPAQDARREDVTDARARPRHHSQTIEFPTRHRRAFRTRARPRWSSSPTATSSSSRSRRSTKRIGDATVRMLAYNGSIPGPTLKVRQGSEVIVNVDEPRRPRGDRALARAAAREPLRRHARDAGADPGRRDASPTRCTFPDPGVYWYHPHIREDYGQEMGLYGNILVVPTEPDYWPPANRELLLTLDDILIEDGKIAPFSRVGDDARGDGPLRQRACSSPASRTSRSRRKRGEVVRFYFTNTANTRVFNVDAAGRADEARRRRQRPLRARGVRRGGAARAVRARRRRRALRPAPASSTLEHRTPERTYRLAVDHRRRRAGRAVARRRVRRAADERATWPAERERIAPYLEARARQDARVRRRDGHGRARGRGRSSTPARCTPRSSATSRAAARSAA